ncbi:MAG: WD40/YVTN/BNR-like repeat-containing protein, partial [Actinomycetota bacterium]
PLASALATHPKDARTVYLGVEVGGLYRSRDRGKTWYDLDLPSSDVHSVQVSPARPDRVYATTGEGAFCSDDGGFNWRKMAGHANAYTMGLAAHPGEPDRVIISAAKTPPPGWGAAGGARCDVYLSTDAGRRFRTVAKALKGAVQRRALLINPKVPSEVVFGTSTGELYYSNDGGESFDLMETGLGDIKAITFA